MRHVLIVGAGQAGLQLGLSLHTEGYRVTIFSARTPEQIHDGHPTSTQAMFDLALETERAYDLDHWAGLAPPVNGLRLSLSAAPGTLALQFSAPLDRPGRSVDQRIKMSRWLRDAEQRGIEVVYGAVTPADLDAYTRDGGYDLTVVAAGKGDLVALFERDPQRSPYTAPQRGLAVAYVQGLLPDPAWPQPHVAFQAIPGLGELFVIPLLTTSGAGHALFWEAIPDGPLDLFAGTDDARHLELSLGLIKQYLPWVHERCADVRLTDDRATLTGRYTPTVRHPVAHLPGGGVALGLGDVVIANDPITGQGSNTAAKAAQHYLQAILSRGERPFDEQWMTETFESFWTAHGRAATVWTNAMLQPLPPHVQRVLVAAATSDAVARRFAHGFTDPNDVTDWLLDPRKAAAFLAEAA